METLKRLARPYKTAVDRRWWCDDPDICRAFDEGLFAGVGIGVVAALLVVWAVT